MCNFAANYTTSFLTVKSTPTMFEKASGWLHHASCHFTTFSGRSKEAIGRRDENFLVEGKVSHCGQDRFHFICFDKKNQNFTADNALCRVSFIARRSRREPLSH